METRAREDIWETNIGPSQKLKAGAAQCANLLDISLNRSLRGSYGFG